jgi:hypothetical protein
MGLLEKVFQSVAYGVPVALVLAFLIKAIGSWQISMRLRKEDEDRPVARVK